MQMPGMRFRASTLAVLLAAPFVSQAQRPPSFQHEVRPIFEQACFQCHGAEKPMAGLDARSIASLMAGGAGGSAIVPGDPDNSPLIQQLESGKMPMGGEKLTPARIQLVKAWIRDGRFPSLDAALDEARKNKITDEDRKHWAFQPPRKHEPPTVKEASRVRTPIDAFALERLEAQGWSFNPDADRATLIRRAYLDLIGIPPTPEEVRAFVDDPNPKAYDELVDRLLASPHYGERWGRHWLDVAGYSDSVGNAADELRPLSWEYRDWVIRAFSEDKPFDRFLIEQLAGDQVVNYKPGAKPNPEHIDELIATGFLRAPPDITDTQTIYQVDKWFDAQQTTVETSLKAIMGLTLGCARCHDHRFDPILQEDYYRLTAVYQAAFDPENWIPAALGFGHWPTRYILDADPDHRDRYIQAALEEYPEIRRERNRVSGEYSRKRREWREQATAELAENGGDPSSLEEISNEELDKLYPELAARAKAITEREQAYKELMPRRIWGLWDVSKEPSPAYVLLRGNYLAPGAPVEPGVPLVLDDPDNPFRFPEPKEEWHHTGRRLTLAKWLTKPDHPLTTRVFVNRVWQYHFGEGIVRTPDDFGSQGAPPTHPELLDWLATTFVENGWSVKDLHRKIMLSTAYRQSSSEVEERMAEDPSNKLLWRKSPLRLDAEAIRDSILAVSGRLDLEMFGKYEPLAQAPDGQWVIDTGNGGNKLRRSLYITNRRSGTHGFLLTFDAPPMDNGNMPHRFRSALPTQSLAMMNNEFVLESAAALADRTRREAGGDFDARILRAFELTYGKAPDAGQVHLAHSAIESSGDEEAGWRTLCQALLASNEFLYVF